MDYDGYKWLFYRATDNRAGDVLVCKAGRYIDGIGEVEEEPDIVYEIEPETLHQLIETCLESGLLGKRAIVGDIVRVYFEPTNGDDNG